MFKMSNPTKLGLQACIAILLASSLAFYTPLVKPYWAVMTSLLLISQTWGESIRRSFYRILMTIVGGIVGTVIYHYCHQFPVVILIFMLLSVFFAAYLIEMSYAASMFFVTMFVVFLFATIMGWSAHLLVIRIYETLIGAAITLITSALVFPIKAKTNFNDQMPKFMTSMQDAVAQSFEVIAQHGCNKHQLLNINQKLMLAHEDLLINFKAMSYENLFKVFPQKKLDAIMFLLGIMYHYISNMLNLLAKADNPPSFDILHDDLAALSRAFSNNFTIIHALLAQQKPNKALISIAPIRDHIRKTVDADIQAHDNKIRFWFDFFAYVFMLRKVDEGLVYLQENLCIKPNKGEPL